MFWVQNWFLDPIKKQVKQSLIERPGYSEYSFKEYSKKGRPFLWGGRPLKDKTRSL